ncbi:hypothetical protein BDQ12DRAFT_675175 [Crucibulum laeve]|uniref:Actin cytoskeleton-regulatory complex protein SLA1 n=1 Tax=Crucibulum laeve TaxID=68775 RepID=A0A5C3MQP8_9AGAR|nr:hypothetical protein BDQ12DRAFT_675175 [Crucibulum laeve]
MAAPDPDKYLAILKASYDYAPQSDDEIPIKEDQLLYLLEKVDEDWWKVKIKGDTQETDSPVGLVPAAYVEQANHTSVAKVLYNYEAAAPGELSVQEDETLLVFDTDDDWLLCQSQKEERAGYVPGNYVETASEDEPSAVPARIVVPDSPPRPTSTYVDPAARVASAKVTADDIKTWAVSEIDKKGKKKKGTLGIGNGAVFFASEADKTPVQKWQTAEVLDVIVEKPKHVRIEIGGASPISLHFHTGSKENAEEITEKLESSKALSTPAIESAKSDTPRAVPSPLSSSPKKASVHFSAASPVIIPPRDQESEEEETDEPEPAPVAINGHSKTAPAAQNSEKAVALYDFAADGEDELSVAEGEQLTVLEKDGDEWWKCRNSRGLEGVVPASYVEVTSMPAVPAPPRAPPRPPVQQTPEDEEDDNNSEAQAAQEALDREEAERIQQQEEEERERERERAEKARKKAEAQQRARDAAAAAEAERRKRKEAAAARMSPPPAASTPRSPSRHDTAPSPGSSRPSAELGRPPPERTRMWHDRSGQFRVEAAFLGFTNGKLRLHKINGVIVEVPAEKMSIEDMRYVEKLSSRKSRAAPTATQRVSEDDIPLAISHPGASTSPQAKAVPPAKKAPKIDWFDFFLSAGCDLDDCTRYAASFERDKIDESILPDITDATMRSLGLREGDIIRVTKAIEKRKPTDNLHKPSANLQEQVRRDEELARQLQAQETGGRNSGSRSPAPNLFAGPGGVLKNPRRGRPQPSKSLPPSNVDLKAITTASDQIQRTSSPQTMSPAIARPSSAALPPRSSSTAPVASGFDDDAWTNRPSSTRPTSAAPPAVASPPPAPPVPALAPAPAAAAPSPTPTATTTASQPTATPSAQPAPAGLAKTTESDIFDQLARLSELRKSSTPSNPPPAASPSIVTPPQGYNSGLGMGASSAPMGQFTGIAPQPSPQPQTYNGPRGPFAPVPANQSLLQPLIPTQTGFNSFIPTRPSNNVSPFQSRLSPPFIGHQQTGIPPQQPMMSQATGVPFGGFNAVSPFQNPPSFQPVQSHITGFNPGMNQSVFSNGMSPPPPVPPLPSSTSNNTNPANIFAQMKSGTFANENESGIPQSSDKYDALRPNGLAPQATGWGQSYPSYMGYQH